MPGLNLTRDEARTRADLLTVHSYEVTLDLTRGERVFRSTTVVSFDAEPGASTFIDAVTDTVKCVDRTAKAERTGPSTSQRGERSTSECATLRIEEWKHRFRRGDSDATASCDGQQRASRVNVVGQATKSMRWMPWRQEPTKDVAGSEMLRGVASKR